MAHEVHSEDGVAGRIRSAAEVVGRTQGEIAAEVGVTQASISQWINGRSTPLPEHLDRLAKALGVRRSWLETGVGSPREINHPEQRASYEKNARWGFRAAPADGGRDYGNANVWSFNPDLDTFVREVLQNARDASLTVEGKVEVTFRFETLRGQPLDDYQRAMKWGDLVPHLRAASKNQQKLGAALRAGLEQVEEDGELLLLVIEETGTHGLTGEERGGGSFAALCRNNLDSQKQGSAGGAFGLGKAVLWRASQVATVIFSSNLASPVSTGKRYCRVFGRSDLAWHEHDGRCFAGPGWLGAPEQESNDEVVVSYWDNPTLARDLRFRRDELGPGTSVCVVGFHDPSADRVRTPKEMAEDILRATGKWFWPALCTGRLSVRVETREEGRTTYASEARVDQLQKHFHELFRRYGDGEFANGGQLVDEGDVVVRDVPLTVPAHRTDRSRPECRHEARLVVRRGTPDDPKDVLHRLALVRGPRMVVRYLDLSGLCLGVRPFEAVLLCGEAVGSTPIDRAADQFLRATEPPAHNDWTSTADLKVLYAHGAKTKLDRFLVAAREQLRQLVRPASQPSGDGPESVKSLFRLGGESESVPRDRPRIRAEKGSHVNSAAQWEITATVKVKTDKRGYRIEPRVIFNADSGRGIGVEWDRLEALSGCTVDNCHAICLEAGTREARFRGWTNVATHPVSALFSSALLEVHRHVRM